MLKVRVKAVLHGQNYRIKPVPANDKMTQDVGIREDGTLVTYPSMSNAVQYVPQELTEEQQMQARANLGLYGYSEENPEVCREQSWGGVNQWIGVLDIPDGLPESAKTVIDGYGEFTTDKQTEQHSVPMVGSDTIYWHGNSNLLNNVDSLVNAFGEFSETKYTDLEFVIYYASGDVGLSGALFGVITTDGVDMAAYSYITMYDLSSEQRVYRRIPEEYLPESVLNKADRTGWIPDMYIGTDAEGNLVEKEAPSGGTGTPGEPGADGNSIYQSTEDRDDAGSDTISRADATAVILGGRTLRANDFVILSNYLYRVTQISDFYYDAELVADLKGDPGQPGSPGSDYILTEDDKTEIAQEAASLVDTALLSIIGEVTE